MRERAHGMGKRHHGSPGIFFQRPSVKGGHVCPLFSISNFFLQETGLKSLFSPWN